MRLWERDPAKLAVVLGVACLAALLGGALLHPVFGGLLGFALIAGATTDFWLPQHFTLSGTGASLRCGISVTSIGWGDVKRVVYTDEGVKLSPLEAATRLAPFRGVFLRFANNRDEVIEEVKRHWEGDVRPLEG